MRTIYSRDSGRSAEHLPSNGLAFPTRIASFESHEDAQHSVNYLADNGFPVKACQIVGSDLRRVEQVVGRTTVVRAAGMGALTGMWAGLFVGLVLGLFATVSGWGIVVAGTIVIGGLFGLLFGLVSYSTNRERRHHFETTVHTVAGRYDLMVEHRYAEWARSTLVALPGGLGSWIPADPSDAA